jgi:hypothetical protein
MRISRREQFPVVEALPDPHGFGCLVDSKLQIVFAIRQPGAIQGADVFDVAELRYYREIGRRYDSGLLETVLDLEISPWEDPAAQLALPPLSFRWD